MCKWETQENSNLPQWHLRSFYILLSDVWESGKIEQHFIAAGQFYLLIFGHAMQHAADLVSSTRIEPKPLAVEAQSPKLLDCQESCCC